MPERNFSRNETGDSERKFGEAPILGRVSRTPLSAAEERGKRRRRMKRKTRVNKAVVAWTLLVSFVLLLLMVVFLVSHFRKKAAEAAEASTLEESSRRLANAFSDQKTVELPTIGEVEALAIVRAAFANADPQAMARHFILGENGDPSQALSELAATKGKEGDISSYRWMGEKYVNGGVIGEVVTHRRNGDERSKRLAQLVIGADGKWRIDLDSYLRKCDPSWPQIISGESPISLIRIFVAPDTYYNGIYSEEAQWRVYALVSPDATAPIFGYAKRGSAQDKALRQILRSGGDVHRATVEIIANPEAGERQFEISGVLAESWVMRGTRFDESF